MTEHARRFVMVAAERRTYRHLAYLVLAIPLGGIYFIGLTAGFTVGVASAVVLIGIPRPLTHHHRRSCRGRGGTPALEAVPRSRHP